MINQIFNSMTVDNAMKDFDSADTDPYVFAWLDIRHHSNFAAILSRIAGDNAVLAMRLIGNTALDGSGDDVEIVAKVIDEALQPTTALDRLVLECTTDQIMAANQASGKVILAVAAELTVDVQEEESDIFFATLIRSGARYTEEGMTGDILTEV